MLTKNTLSINNNHYCTKISSICNVTWLQEPTDSSSWQCQYLIKQLGACSCQVVDAKMKNHIFKPIIMMHKTPKSSKSFMYPFVAQQRPAGSKNWMPSWKSWVDPIFPSQDDKSCSAKTLVWNQLCMTVLRNAIIIYHYWNGETPVNP